MKADFMQVNVEIKLSLTEALELERRLHGGSETETTKALGRAIAIQLEAASELLQRGVA